MCASLLLAWCRETDQVVEEHFQEDGPYKPIKFEQKYAKRFGVQYLVNQPSDNATSTSSTTAMAECQQQRSLQHTQRSYQHHPTVCSLIDAPFLQAFVSGAFACSLLAVTDHCPVAGDA